MVQGDIIGSQIRTRPTSMGMGFDSIFSDLMDFSPMKEIKFAVTGKIQNPRPNFPLRDRFRLRTLATVSESKIRSLLTGGVLVPQRKARTEFWNLRLQQS